MKFTVELGLTEKLLKNKRLKRIQYSYKWSRFSVAVVVPAVYCEIEKKKKDCRTKSTVLNYV